MNKENGYFTVEAAILFPFILLIVLGMAYVLIFTYDRALLSQDSMAVLQVACNEGIEDESLLQSRLVEELKLYKDEHPYILAKNLSLAVETKPYYVSVKLSVEPEMPMITEVTKFLKLPSIIEYENSAYVINPSRVMLIINDLEKVIGEDDE